MTNRKVRLKETPKREELTLMIEVGLYLRGLPFTELSPKAKAFVGYVQTHSHQNQILFAMKHVCDPSRHRF